ncbi:hypothetical protein FD977_02390 [Polynucleobacter sp. AP-Elch-400A-B2]|uniref:beta strand repeat-containing protein n=1 Tax=Polynucleobacter sp. AP-Elch-400A-B2 TaxID=2576930 RepID=UPI001BFEC278|nr:hypothetical protein [Polynucleobacter sp. AP-Elch-400A-B2]QWE25129.1 hypothetical protein FD977_02390 [Polynucleobacter sp. AP-Elch-400A-B2]
MTLAIKIGASAQVYDNLSLANSMRGYQKLSIVGTGEEIKAELTSGRLSNDIAANVGSIKATNDLNLTADEVTQYKAALIKLGTKSIVLNSATDHTAIEGSYLGVSNFNSLDAVYTKIKSITLSDPATKPKIAIEKLATAVNLGGLEALTGQNFDVSGNATTIKANMDSLLKNVSRINKIVIADGESVEFTAAQLSVLGDKLQKNAVTTKVVLNDTADNILTTASLSLINRLNNTNINAPSTKATVTSVSGNVILADKSFNTGDAVTYNGAQSAKDGVTYYARKIDDTHFSIYTSFAQAVNTTTTTGIVDPTGIASAETFISQVGNYPLRNTTLDSVKVTKATLAQADRLTTLTAIKSGVPSDPANPAVVNRDLSNIISSVEIADTAAKLDAGGVTKTSTGIAYLASAGTAIASYTAGIGSSAGKITISGNAFTTGQAVTYSKTTGGLNELGNGATYFVGLDSADNTGNSFYLFTSKAAALAADTSTAILAKTGGALNLNAGQNPIFANNKFVASTAGVISVSGGHGYDTGDAVTYNTASGGIKIAELTDSNTYYVGKITGSTTQFALFNTKSAALTATLTNATTAAESGAITFAYGQSVGAADAQFNTSNLFKTMIATSQMKDNTGSVARVTIKGDSSAITALTLGSIASKALNGNSNAMVTYAAKAVEISKNLQALVDNTTATKKLTEIVVTDGTVSGKKGFSLSKVAYDALKLIFNDGVDHVNGNGISGNGTNKNYSFTVTAATNGYTLNPSALQGDVNVSSYAVTGVTASYLLTGTNLVDMLSNSKLKTITTEAITDAPTRVSITNLLNQIGSAADRAKLKIAIA